MKLTRVSTVGFYYVDEMGNGWASEEGPPEECMACGKPITRRYADGRVVLCPAHVREVDNRTPQERAEAEWRANIVRVNGGHEWRPGGAESE